MNTNIDDNKNQYIEKLEKHISEAKLSSKYSTDRFDILIITLSSSSIILSINFLDSVVINEELQCLCLLIISWCLFGSTIIFNLFSQLTAYNAHKWDIETTKTIIKIEKGKELCEIQEKQQKKCDRWNSGTLTLNWFSVTSFVIGLILLIIFLSINIQI